MNTTTPEKKGWTPKPGFTYTANIYYRHGNGSQDVFRRKACGWSYDVFLNGKCISAGCGLRDEYSAREQAKAAARFHFQQNGGGK